MQRHVQRVTAIVHGHDAEIWLQVPCAGFELPLLPDEPEGDLHQILRVTELLAGFIESIDGIPPSNDTRIAFAADPGSCRALLELRSRLFDAMRMEGLAHLRCPRCAADATVDLATLAIALGPNPWPVAGGDGMPTVPALSQPLSCAVRPTSAARAAAARVTLPSARRSLPRSFSSATFRGEVTPAMDSEGQRRWDTATEDPAPATGPMRTPRAWAHAGFRTAGRLALALECLDDMTELRPDIIESLPMTDVLFLDAVYHYLFRVPVHDPDRASIACAQCSARFLPVG